MAEVISLRVPKPRLFVGSYKSIRVKIDPSSGLVFDDLDFKVVDGPRAGRISLSRGPKFNPAKPDVMLLVGFEPGEWKIVVTHMPSGTDVGSAIFRSTARWRNKRRGPRLWFDGVNTRGEAGAAWGGGPVGPQNVNVLPATGTRRIAILLVDTSSQRYPTGAALDDIRKRWMDHVVDGVTSGGVTRSSRLWYREVSYGGFDLSAQIFGPVSLSGPFTDYFNDDGTPKGSYFQSCFTAGDGEIDYTQFDTLLCVSRSVPASGGDPAKRAWPYASIGSWGPYTTSDGNVVRGVVSMPVDWDAGDANRLPLETFSHELGHNLGLGDQYTPAVGTRNPGGWEMMDADNPFPHFSVAHRMMLGWVPGNRIRSFNFQALGGAAVDETVTLHAIEEQPPAGSFSGVEVRIADGLNYYFEYRAGRGGQIGDQSLPTNARVLGTDVASAPFVPPFERPTILLLPNDPDGDGPVLNTGQNFRQTDNSTPGFPADFRAEVTSIAADSAQLRIRYGVIGKPDPSIRPWPASADRPWQSPDIEVRNARSAADAAWFNVPWEGHSNDVVAKVKNGGSLDAPGVLVEFYVKNFNVGGAPEVFLGSDVKDIPSGATVEFTTNWVPPSQGHFCIVVRIPIYQLPGGAAVEITEFNNVAQSNYDRFISRTASPATREETFVEVANPYDEPTRIFVVGGQSNPLYRTYVATTWLLLDPGEKRRVKVMLESKIDPEKGIPEDVDPRDFEKFFRTPNDVGLTSFVEDPKDRPRHALWQLGGAQVQVVTGRKTEFGRVEPAPQRASGVVVTVDDGKGVSGGKVIGTVKVGRGRNRKTMDVTADVRPGGDFTIGYEGEWETLDLYYVPVPDLADCTAGTFQLR